MTIVKDLGSRIIGFHRLSTKYALIVTEDCHGHLMNLKNHKVTQIY